MLLEVKVSPNAKSFRLWFKGGWRVNITSPPEKGKANLELERELGRLLESPVKIIRGHSSKRKVLEVGLDENEFGRRTKAYREAKEPRKGP